MSIKLTEQEIETIKGFQEKTNAIIADLGRIELQKLDLDSAKEQVLGVKSKMAEEQNEFFKSVEESYGKGQINLDTFEFFPTEEKE
jgi:hypothetical protein